MRSRTRVVILAVTALVILVAAGWVGYKALVGSSAAVERVANQFAASPEWTLREESVTKDPWVCLGDTRCPSVGRNYVVPASLTLDDLRGVLATSGWDLTITGDCTVPDDGSRPSLVSCSATGTVDGYYVSVRLIPPHGPVPDRVLSLDVEPAL